MNLNKISSYDNTAFGQKGIVATLLKNKGGEQIRPTTVKNIPDKFNFEKIVDTIDEELDSILPKGFDLPKTVKTKLMPNLDPNDGYMIDTIAGEYALYRPKINKFSISA